MTPATPTSHYTAETHVVEAAGIGFACRSPRFRA